MFWCKDFCFQKLIFYGYRYKRLYELNMHFYYDQRVCLRRFMFVLMHKFISFLNCRLN
uniref:Uncharacterized protein n=1 Tax=Microplitis mediator bracovirus TaxID=1836595 RepID=A0A2I6SGU1_9VIRU|nr:hypothetical protein MmBV_CLP3 [Microplitis mediator bracovirus]